MKDEAILKVFLISEREKLLFDPTVEAAEKIEGIASELRISALGALYEVAFEADVQIEKRARELEAGSCNNKVITQFMQEGNWSERTAVAELRLRALEAAKDRVQLLDEHFRAKERVGRSGSVEDIARQAGEIASTIRNQGEGWPIGPWL